MIATEVWTDGLSGLDYVGTLRKEEIVQIADRLITPTPPADSNMLQSASVDLTVGAVFTKDDELVLTPDETERFVTLKPGEMAIVVTHQELHLPLNIVGLTMPITTKSLRGLLLLTHGQIDPGYRGGIIVRVLNIRNQTIHIRLTERIITVMFEQLPVKALPYPFGYKDLAALRSEAADLATGTVAGVVMDAEGGSLARLVRQEVSDKLRESRVRRAALYTLAGTVGGILVKVVELLVPLVQQYFSSRG